nr:MAG TPA: hypothetical protein [Caudoviricetes sp.]
MFNVITCSIILTVQRYGKRFNYANFLANIF